MPKKVEANQTKNASFSDSTKNLRQLHFEVPPNKTFDAHAHESEQITYVLTRALFFEIEAKTYRVGPGDCIAIPSNIPHRVWTTEKGATAVDAWAPVNETYV